MIQHQGIELTRASEAIAIEASRFIGLGDEKGLRSATSIRTQSVLSYLELGGTVSIGEPEGPLADGTVLSGRETERHSLALRPVEGVSATALGGRNALSLVALCTEGSFPAIPPIYMHKVVVQPWAAGQLDLSQPVATLLPELAKIKGVKANELRAIVLDRPRNQRIIEEIRATGVRVSLIMDGDVALSLGIITGQEGADILLGSGGAREAVFTAAAARASGDQFLGKFLLRTENDEQALLGAGFSPDQFHRVLAAADLAPGNVSISATAITDTEVLSGVRFEAERAHTQSLLLRSATGTIRTILSSHLLIKNLPVVED